MFRGRAGPENLGQIPLESRIFFSHVAQHTDVVVNAAVKTIQQHPRMAPPNFCIVEDEADVPQS